MNSLQELGHTIMEDREFHNLLSAGQKNQNAGGTVQPKHEILSKRCASLHDQKVDVPTQAETKFTHFLPFVLTRDSEDWK